MVVIQELNNERAILIGIDLPKSSIISAEDSLIELAELARTAGAEVIDTKIQKRNRPTAAYFLGKGFVEEIGLQAVSLDANLIIVDEELSGSQLRNLEELTTVRVIDRTTLILDIFAQRARSREGKLQVELAQLSYRLPRLKGLGVEMSRLAGGIGTRGPGESKLESDRRHLQSRIRDIKKELTLITKQQKVKTMGRAVHLPLVVLIGYTNAGKSSIRYRLLQESPSKPTNMSPEDSGTDKLFATLDPSIRGIKLNNAKDILLGDTVGFIQKLPHQLVSAFKTTLEDVLEADLLLHVVDISNPLAKEQQDAVYQVLNDIGASTAKRITIYNKIDLVKFTAYPKPADDSPFIPFSAKTGEGVQSLLKRIETELPEQFVPMRVYVPFSDGRLLAKIHSICKITSKNHTESGTVFELEAPGYFVSTIEPYSIIQ